MQDMIGVDLGGTQLRAVCCTADGTIVKHVAMPTPTEGPAAVIDQIVRLVNTVRGNAPLIDFAGVGVGTPGPVDGRIGLVFKAPNLKDWENIPLKQLLEERLPVPVEVGNDANAAALGEWVFGSGQGTTDFVYATISTGIGGGVICDNRLLLGRNGMAGEVGHMIIDANGPICSCGNRGCWEALASGTALARRASEEMRRNPGSRLHALTTPDTITAADVTKAAQQGDPVSRRLLHEEGALIGIGVVNLLHLFSPALVALGGGVMHSYEFLRDAMRAEIASRAMEPYQAAAIELATLGQNVGVLGAAALVMAAHHNRPIA